MWYALRPAYKKLIITKKLPGNIFNRKFNFVFLKDFKFATVC